MPLSHDGTEHPVKALVTSDGTDSVGGGRKIISVIDDPDVIDAVLHHIEMTGLWNPSEQRAPPAA